MDHTNNNTKRTMFHKPKLVDAVKVEGRSIFSSASYYFAWYDDGSYSLYDGESLKYLGGVKRFNFGSIVSGSQRVAKFDRPTEIGAEYRLFYDAVHTIEQNKSLEAQKIARDLGVHQSHLVSMYYYNPDDHSNDYVWENYKKMRKLFVDKCRELGIEYETDSNAIINQVIQQIDENEGKEMGSAKKDVSYCTSIESIKKYFYQRINSAATEYDLSNISSDFIFTKQDLIEYTSSFFRLSDSALIALKNGKKGDMELLKKYTEFLVALPMYCQLLSEMEKCSGLANAEKQNLKLKRFYDNPDFIQNINGLIEHDPDEVTYHYHVTGGANEAEHILEDGLYMFSDRIESTSFPELTTNDLLGHGYGNDFASFDDYIIVFAEPKGEKIVRTLSDEEKSKVLIMPRRMGLTDKPSYVIDSKYIVGYIDKSNCQVVANEGFVRKASKK